MDAAKALLQFRRLVRIAFSVTVGDIISFIVTPMHTAIQPPAAPNTSPMIFAIFRYGSGTPHGSQFFAPQPGRRAGDSVGFTERGDAESPPQFFERRLVETFHGRGNLAVRFDPRKSTARSLSGMRCLLSSEAGRRW